MIGKNTILAVGEVLWDIFPHYRRIGGAPFNFAFHTHQLGEVVNLVSGIGDDADGKKIMNLMRNHLMETSSIQIIPGYSTGKVQVQLDEAGKPDFNILTDMAYDHIQYRAIPSQFLNRVDLIYFGTLIQRSPHGFETLQQILKQRPAHSRCLYDVNLRPGCYNEKIIRESLVYSDIVKLNDEELNVLKEMFTFSGSNEAFIDFLLNEYRLDMLCLTQGDRGSHLYTINGHSFSPAVGVDNIADTVGAGDAYVAVLGIGYMNGWQREKILKTASVFSAEICQIEGAVPLKDTKQFYQDFIIQFLREDKT